MREDPEEYEREARLSLAEASSELRAQLFGIAGDLSSFKRAMLQITEEGIRDVADTAKTSMSNTVDQFAGIANEVIEKILLAFAAFSDHSAQLNDIASKNVDALETLFQRIENIEASPNLVSEKLEPIIEKLNEVADEAMRRNRNQTNDLKRVKRNHRPRNDCLREQLRNTLTKSDEVLLRGRAHGVRRWFS